MYLGAIAVLLRYSSGRIEFYRGLPATGGCASTQYISFNESGGERMVETDNDCYLRQRAVPYLGRLIRELGTFMDELPAGRVPEVVVICNRG